MVWLRRAWPFLLSLTVVLHAIRTAITSGPGDAADVGNFVAGYASALAFIWLVAGYFLQWEELRLQRKELRETREMMRLQKEEARRLAENSALGVIGALLEDFRRRLPEHMERPRLGTFEDITHHLLTETDRFRVVLDPRFRQQAPNDWLEWHKSEGIARRFLEVVRECALLHVRATGGPELTESPEIEKYIIANDAKLSAIPHIREAMWSARVLATVLDEFAPMIEKARLVGSAETVRVLPELAEGDVLRNVLRQRIRAIEESIAGPV